jgi:RNA polymerase sigma factor (sigma-70 family)
MTPTPANDNQPRPASFDAAVLEWRPLLRKIASRFEPRRQDREDLVQETIMTALHRWASYRPEAKLSTWLVFQMRAVVQARRRKPQLETISVDMMQAKIDNQEALGPRVMDHFTASVSIPATQAAQAPAMRALAQLGDTRGERALVRLAAGETGQEVANTMGISRERVRQITDVAREGFRKRVGWGG